MKKMFFTSLLLFLLAAVSLPAQDQAAAPSDQGGAQIAMYYFHTSFRCATCRAVEEQSKLAFEALYPEQFKNGTATFQAVNIDEEANKSLVDQYKIAGQTLLLVKGDKTADLTSEGFLYAKTDPDKLKEAIHKAADEL